MSKRWRNPHRYDVSPFYPERIEEPNDPIDNGPPDDCLHPPESVTADLMEGDYRDGIRWCRICGAVQRYSHFSTTTGEWRTPERKKQKGTP